MRMSISTPASGTNRIDQLRSSTSYGAQPNFRSFHPYLPRATSSSATPNHSLVPQLTASNSTSRRPRPHSIPHGSLIHPPSAPRRHSIPLPCLSAAETEINPLLISGINYNIGAPTSSADCPSRRHSSRGRDAWRYEPAVHPNVPSLTIYLDCDPQRPIVVFPTNSYDTVITVTHVLAAVNRRVTALGGELREAYVAGYEVQLMRREVYWDGLVHSRTEREVWILRTR